MQFPSRSKRHESASVVLRWLALAVLLGALPAGCAWSRRERADMESLARCRRLTSRACNALERGRTTEAETMLAEAIALCDVDPEAHRRYAEALARREAYTEALAQLDTAVKLSGEAPTLLVERAEMRLKMNNAQAALADVDEALDIDPGESQAWLLRARIHRKSGQPRQALADYQRTLGLAPDSREALFELADLYWELGQQSNDRQWRFQQSLATLQTLNDRYPPGAEPRNALFLMGLVCRRLNRNDDAADAFLAATHRGEADVRLWYLLAEAQLAAGRRQDALGSVQQGLKLNPQHGESLALWNHLHYELTRRSGMGQGTNPALR